MHKARKNSKSISLTGDATGRTPAERGRDVGETVAAGPVRSFQSVLRRFHNTPLDLYSSSGILSWRRSRTLRISALVSSFALVLLITAIIVPLYNKLEVTEAATGTAKESSLSFNLTNSTASVDLSVNDINGTFASSSDDNSKVKFNISTTNYTGYTLSIKGINNNQTLVNSTNSSYTLSSISTATESFNSTDYNNKWGYLPSKLNSSTNSKYQPSPTTAATTLDTTSSANSSVNTYTIGIGARASYTTPAGEYTGTYILTAVGNTVSYSITFNKGNTSDTVSNLPSTQSSSGTSSTSITLSSTKPTRTGYTFTGWCMGTISTNTSTHVDSCTGTNSKTFNAGSSFGIDQTTSNITTLYAMWTRNNVTYTLNYNANNGTGAPNSQSNTNNNGSYTFTLNTTTIPTRSGYNFLGYAATSSATTPTYTYTAGTGTNGANGTFSPSTITLTQSSMSSAAESTTLYAVWEVAYDVIMQGLSSSDCTTTAKRAQDTRDGTIYTIQRLNDGNCWLLDNLALDLVTYKDNLTSSNTNATDIELSYLKNGGGTASDKWPTSALANWPVYPGNSVQTYSIPWMDAGYKDTVGTGGYEAGKYGIYYNFCAASAGTYCYGDGNSYGNTASGNATSDICPKGWRMPTGGTSGEYQALYDKNSGYYNFVQVFHAPLSGYRHTAYGGQGLNGNIWASTYVDSYRMNYIGYNKPGAGVYPYYNTSRNQGYSVRCILSENISNITYMQQVNSNMVAKMAANTTYTLKDARDNQDYTVAKLADGKLWMTKNLNLARGTKLYSGDSDVPAGYDSTPYYALHNLSDVINSGSTTCGANMPCYSYYTWNSATVGSGSSLTTGNAPYSICAAGWRLPTAGFVVPYTDYDFYNFATSYGMPVGNYYTASDGATFYNNVNGGDVAGKAPVNLVLSGNYGEKFDNGGTHGLYWSASAGSGNSAILFQFSQSQVYSAAQMLRYVQNSVRCLFAG